MGELYCRLREQNSLSQFLPLLVSPPCTIYTHAHTCPYFANNNKKGERAGLAAQVEALQSEIAALKLRQGEAQAAAQAEAEAAAEAAEQDRKGLAERLAGAEAEAGRAQLARAKLEAQVEAVGWPRVWVFF